MSFIGSAKCFSWRFTEGKKQATLWLLQQKWQSKQRNLHCPPIKLTFFADLSPQTIGLPLNFAHQSWMFPFLAHIHAAELFRQAPICPIWNGRENVWCCQAEDYIFVLVEVSGSSESLWLWLSLCATLRGFFYCPCQLAAQGYCQLSVSALIFVSYGQVLLVICYLFSFVQPELYLSTN